MRKVCSGAIYWLSALVFAMGICKASAYAADDPDVGWTEIETQHFFIHFPETKKHFAQKAAQLAEEAHRILSPALRWIPREKTHIVVEGNLDDANGWARSTPVNEIHLYAYPPPQISELSAYDDWVRQLVFHEYTHILHTDHSASALYDVINAIMGKIARNNATSPRWYAEGLAVYFETKTGAGGRLRNPVYQTLMRQAALSDDIPSLGTLSAGMSKWPAGMGVYLYGAFFLEWLAKTYGDEKFSEFHAHYGDDWIPYGLNRAAFRTWGKTFDELYDLWRKQAKIHAAAQKIAWLTAGKMTPHQTVAEPYRHACPQPMRKKNAISYVRNNGVSGQAIVERNADSGRERALVRCDGQCAHRWSRDDKRLYFTQSVTEDGYRVAEKLFVYDVSSGKTQNVEKTDHVRAIALDNDVLYWVEQTDESTSLHRRAIGGESDEIIFRSAEYEQIDSIDARNGEVLASVFDPVNAQVDLFIFEPSADSGASRWNKTRLTNDAMRELSPFWGENGEIFYVGDASGMLNLWHYDRETSRSLRLSHLIDGMAQPVRAADGAFYYVGYAPKGKSIERIEPSALAVYQTIDHKHAQDSEMHAQNRDGGDIAEYDVREEYDVRDYKPHRWLWPQTWMPAVAIAGTDSKIGASISRSDFASHHKYDIKIGYYPLRNDFEYSAGYAWTGGVWGLGLYHAMTPGRSAYRLKPGRYRYFGYQSVSASAETDRAWNTRLSSHVLSLGYDLNYQYAKDNLYWLKDDPIDYPQVPALGWRNALTARWRWSSLRRFERSMTPGDGYALSIALRFEAPWLGADGYSFIARISGTAAWTIPVLSVPQTVQLRAEGGTSASDSPNRLPFSLKTLESGVYANAQDWHFLGYAPDSIYGNHYYYAKLSWNALVAEPDWGVSTLPIGFNRLGIGVFGAWGYAWHDDFDIFDSKADIGAQITAEWTLGYRQSLRTHFLAAWGAGPDGGPAFMLMLEF